MNDNEKSVNFFILFLLIVCIAINNEWIRFVGVAGYWLYWLYCFVQKKMKFKISTDFKMLIPLSLLLGWMLIMTINGAGLVQWAKMAFLSFFFLVDFSYKRVTPKVLATLAMLLGLMVMLDFRWNAIFINPNMTALLIFIPFFIYTMVSTKTTYLFLFAVAGLVLCLMLGSRAVLLAMVLAWVMLALWSDKHAFNPAKIIFMLSALLLYHFADFFMSSEFNEFIYHYTGKEFQSGRFEIWGSVLQEMKWHHYLFGLGGGYDFSELMPKRFRNLSLHSTYVYMLCSYGIVGLSLFLLLLTRILSKLMKKGKKVSAFLLLFFAFRDCFEITLVNNQMAIAALFWSLIANGKIEEIFGINEPKNSDVINRLSTTEMHDFPINGDEINNILPKLEQNKD